MHDSGGTAIRSAPTLVVSLGGSGGGPTWSGAPPELNAAEVQRRIEAERTGTGRARRAAALRTELEALERQREDLAASLLTAAERSHDDRVAREERIGRIDQVAAGRRRLMGDLAVSVAALGDAVDEWQRVLDQQGAAEAALDALIGRVGDDEVGSALHDITSEMAGGEEVLVRSEAARRDGVERAVAAVLAARVALAAETEPLALAGLLRLAAAVSATAGPAAAGAESQRRSLDARCEAMAAELSAVEHEGPRDPASVVLDALDSIAANPVVVDDILVGVDGATAEAVLAELPARFSDRGLVYLTDDVRVLAWAICLPDHIGGVVGVVDAPDPAG